MIVDDVELPGPYIPRQWLLMIQQDLVWVIEGEIAVASWYTYLLNIIAGWKIASTA